CLYFVVKVRSSGATVSPNPADELPSRDDLIQRRIDVRQVPIASRQTTTMVNHDELAITVLPTNKRNGTLGAGDNGSPPLCFNVLTGVEFVPITTKGVTPAAKATFEFALHRPNRWRVPSFTKNCFVGPHILFETEHFCLQGGEAILIKWLRGTTD